MTTVNVTVTLQDASLDAVVGARVSAKLFFPESLTDFIAPESSEVTGTTDALGQVVLAVWPNALNTTVTTYYKFRAWHPTTKKQILNVCAFVPNSNCNLEDISEDCRGTTSGSTGAAESAALAAHIANAGDPHSAAGYITGLSYFTESRTVTAPNATVPVHALTALGAETNIDAVFAPKGSGAISAQIADGTATGGNKRGAYSVDLQTSRTSAAQVASGSYSFASGRQNTVSGTGAVSFGVINSCTGDYGFSAGTGNTCSGTRSVTFGQSSSAAGQYSYARGLFCAAGGSYSEATGNRCLDRACDGKRVYAATYFSAFGDCQLGTHALSNVTTDATPTILTGNGSSATTTTVPVLPDNHAYGFTVKVTARDISNGDAKRWTFEGLVARGANAAATALIGTPTKTTSWASAGAAAWDVDIVANTTRGSVEAQFTGEIGKTIHVICRFDTEEVG